MARKPLFYWVGLVLCLGIAAVNSLLVAQDAAPARGGGGRGGGRGAAGPAPHALAAPMLAQGDKDRDGLLDRVEVSALSAVWFDALDPQKAGRLTQQEFTSRFPTVLAGPDAAEPQPAGGGRGRGGGGAAGGGPALSLFLASDANGDAAVTPQEFTNFFEKWFAAWDVAASGKLTQAQLSAGLIATLPALPLDNLQRPTVDPQSPEDQLKLFRLPPGYKMELVLSDPDIQDPVGVSFDGNGRMYVLEMRSYMRDLSGSNSREPISRISRWEDTNGDGKYDKHTVFLDKLVLPRIAHPLDDNSLLVLETDNYDMYKHTDTDKDGVADKKELFVTGFGRVTNMEWQPGGGLVWALDNWMYSSYNPFRIRISPIGKVLREETAVNGGQWGIAQDNYGKPWFVDGGTEQGPVNFQQPIAYGAFNVPENFEPGFLIPWGAALYTGDFQGGVNRVRVPEGSLNHFTAASGPEIYRGHRLPADAIGDLFFAESVGRLVRRAKVVVRDGVTQLQNAYPKSEFIISTDPLFRPVNVSNAPDGSLYICDMYRGIIQDAAFTGPGSYLRGKIQQFGLEKAYNFGRIWRVTHETAKPDLTQPRMLDETPAQLVAHLEHPNGWWRDTAKELLVLKQDKSVVRALTAMLRTSNSQLGRIHALWTLEGLESLTPQMVREAMQSPDPQIRIQPLRASESLYKGGDKSFATDYRALATDSDVNVVIQAMLTANQMQIPERVAFVRATGESSTSRGVKEFSNQILNPGRSIGQPASLQDQGLSMLNLSTEERRIITQGQAIYRELCFSCHGNDGRGTPMAGAPEGTLMGPPLQSSRVVGHPSYMINILIKGMNGDLDGKTYTAVMAPMSNNDEWIANISSYVRSNFGNNASYVTADQVAAVRAASSGRTVPWTFAELEPTVPVLLTNQSEWKATASDNSEAAMNPLAAPAEPAAARGRGGGGGRGAAAPRWDTGGAQRAGTWFQIELPRPENVAEIEIDAPAGGRGGRGGRGAPAASGPAKYQVQVSTDGSTWGPVVAEGTGATPTTTIALKSSPAKFIRITQTGADENTTWAIQRLRVYVSP